MFLPNDSKIDQFNEIEAKQRDIIIKQKFDIQQFGDNMKRLQND